MMQIALIAVTAALVLLGVVLWVMAAREDIRRARKRQSAEDLWLREPNASAYEAWLMKQDISTWPYEPEAGYDERKEGGGG